MKVKKRREGSGEAAERWKQPTNPQARKMGDLILFHGFF